MSKKFVIDDTSPYRQLPLDLITEILLLLPVESLGQFKLVCKSWNSLISTDKFAKSHLQISASTSNPSHFVISQGKSFLFSLDLKHLKEYCFVALIIPGLFPPLKLEYPFQLLKTRMHGLLGSCHGLICSVTGMIQKPMCVFNLTTKEFRCIPFPPNHQSARIRAFGLGFVPSLNDYKIVLLQKHLDTTYIDVFSLRGAQWKEIDCSRSSLDASLDGSFLITRCPGVWLDEALYWVFSTYPVGSPGGFFILKFDLVKETFLRVSNVEHTGHADRLMKNHNMWTLSIGVIAQKQVCVGQLCFMRTGEVFLEIWMMEKCGQLNKLFRVLQLKPEICRISPQLLGFTPNGNVWLGRHVPGRREIFLLDPSRNPPTYLLVPEKHIDYVISYTPSLVSPSNYVGKSVTE